MPSGEDAGELTRPMLESGADIRFIRQLLEHAKLGTTAIHTEASILQHQEVQARRHPSARLPEAAQPVGSGA